MVYSFSAKKEKISTVLYETVKSLVNDDAGYGGANSIRYESEEIC